MRNEDSEPEREDLFLSCPFRFLSVLSHCHLSSWQHPSPRGLCFSASTTSPHYLYVYLSMNYRNVEKCEFGSVISHLGISQWFPDALRTISKPVSTNKMLSMFEGLINSLISSSEVPLPHKHCLASLSDICVHFCPRPVFDHKSLHACALPLFRSLLKHHLPGQLSRMNTHTTLSLPPPSSVFFSSR